MTKILSKTLKYSWPSVIVYCIIFYLCCIFIPSESEIEMEVPYFDKVVHFFMYFGLTGLSAMFYIYCKKGVTDLKKLIIGAFIIPILYGGLIEIIQAYLIEGRSGDWFDFAADVVGSTVGLLIALRYRGILLLKQLAE